MLDVNLLISTARGVAIEVSGNYKIHLSADGLEAVNILIQETLPELQRAAQEGKFDFDVWKGHIQKVSENMARDFQGRKITEIGSAEEITDRYHELGLHFWPKE